VKIIKRDAKIMSPSMTREYSFVFKKAKGCYLWDVDGRKYLDFAAAVAVAGIGHTNPVLEKAMQQQLKNGIHCGFSDFYAEVPVNFAEELITHLPKQLNKVFLSNSGTESIEAAYKLARWHSNKQWVIAFKNAFHGRTMGSLSMTNSKPVQRDRFGPFMPVKHATFPYPYQMSGRR
jgi:4-aminobutyrate aminotransferase